MLYKPAKGVHIRIFSCMILENTHKMKFLAFQVLLVAIAVNSAYSGVPFFGNGENYNFDKLPDFKNYPLMARFIVHNANYTAVSYKSYQKETQNLSLATIFSTSDGPLSNGTGVLYFYLTEFEPCVKEIFQNNGRCGLMMSIVQTGICDKNKWDAADPRCTRAFLTGSIEMLKNTTAEYAFAKKSFDSRHPYFVGAPPGGHGFFYAKYNIETISLISGFGGVRVVTLKDYFNVKDSTFNLSVN